MTPRPPGDRPAGTRRLALTWLAALSLAAGGCATAPPAPEPQAGVTEAGQWSGRFAATVAEPGPEAVVERASGRFVLESRAGQTLLELLSPLGQTLATATLQDGRAELQTAAGERYEAASAEALVERAFGWRMPIGDLPRWLRGRLDGPGEHENGRQVTGVENDWAIRLHDWRTGGPGRLDLDWPAVPASGQRKLNLKLIVDDAS